MLREAGIAFRAVHVANVEEQSEIIAKTNAKSFPLVFHRDRYVGGFTHIVLLHSQGRLEELTDGATTAGAAKRTATTSAQPSSPSPPTAGGADLGAVRAEIAGYARWGERKKGTGTPT